MITEKKRLTAGELRAKLEGVPDDLPVTLSSDSGVDQGEGEIVVENAYRRTYKLPDGRVFADAGESGVDEFVIYCNDRCDEEDDWDE